MPMTWRELIEFFLIPRNKKLCLLDLSLLTKKEQEKLMGFNLDQFVENQDPGIYKVIDVNWENQSVSVERLDAKK
ncbi:MAG: hypothetical protein KC483_10890 [Nitrosarchaeum sp.]|nr:hypothetical protein [Nitrosarchaeum sp.]